MKTLHLRWMAAALTAAVCFTVFLAAQTHPAQAQSINCANTAMTGIPQAECETLLPLLPFLYGQWTGSLHFCDGDSVECTDGHVTALNMAEHGMPSNTVPDLSALTHLETLDLFRCDLSGEFPAWIANSATLKNVTLTENFFSGPLPDLSAMTSLEYLNITRNGFGGPFPDISSLTTLQELHISENQFTGPLPDISLLPNLKVLWAGSNSFTGTIHSGITASTNLEWLIVRFNDLSGPLPDLRSMTALAHLNVAFNDFSGDLPSTPPFPPGITAIALSSNHFTGSIPASYTELPLLEHLILDSNMLTGEVPSTYVGDLGDLIYNALTASAPLVPTEGFLNTQTVPPTNVAASNVTYNSANVSWTPISYTSGSGSYQVGLSTTSGSGYTFNHSTANKSASGIPLSSLTPGITYYAVVRTVTQPHMDNPNTVTSLNSTEFSFTTSFDPDVLNCADTATTGIPQAECAALVAVFPDRTENVSPCQWREFTCTGGHVTEVNLFNSGVSGTLPDLSALTQLDLFDYTYNSMGEYADDFLTGNFPAWIAASPTLKSVTLAGHQLSGPLPDLSAMVSLEFLNVVDNDFNGSLPNLSVLPNIQYFIGANNDFSGSIPVGITSSTNLQRLFIEGNNLSGPLPDFSGMTNLITILANDNQLSGPLPVMPSNIRAIVLSRNQISGALPQSYAALPNLKYLDLSGNNLIGEIPISFGDVGWEDFPILDYNAFTAPASDRVIMMLHSAQGDFFGTQTIPPTGVAASNVTPMSADLSWTPILYTADTGAYEIGLSNTSGSSYTFNHSTPNKSASGITLSGLTPGTTYYAVIRTVTQPHTQNPNTVTSLNSAEFSFTTLVDPVSVPVLLAPAANGLVRGTNSPMLSWLPNPAGEGVTTYRLVLKNDSTGIAVLKHTVSAANCAAACTVDLGTLAPQVNLPVGVYNWQITATGSLGATKSVKQRFSVVKPDAPVITAPLGTVSDPQPEIAWTVNPDDLNTGYKLKLVGAKSGVVVKKTVSGVCSGVTCAVGLDTLAGGPYLLNNDSYTLTVTAVNEIGSRKATATFKVKFPAPAVDLSPAGGLIVNTPQPVLSWMPDPNASSFTIVLQRIKQGAVVQTFKIANVVNGTQGFVCTAGTCTLDLAAIAAPLSLPKGSYKWAIVSANPAIHPASKTKSTKAQFRVVLP